MKLILMFLLLEYMHSSQHQVRRERKLVLSKALHNSNTRGYRAKKKFIKLLKIIINDEHILMPFLITK